MPLFCIPIGVEPILTRYTVLTDIDNQWETAPEPSTSPHVYHGHSTALPNAPEGRKFNPRHVKSQVGIHHPSFITNESAVYGPFGLGGGNSDMLNNTEVFKPQIKTSSGNSCSGRNH